MSEGVENADYNMKKEIAHATHWKNTNRTGRIVPEVLQKNKVIHSPSGLTNELNHDQIELDDDANELNEVMQEEEHKLSEDLQHKSNETSANIILAIISLIIGILIGVIIAKQV